MYHLATVFPPLKRLGVLPLSRDQITLLFVAVNEMFLGLDHYLAHMISGSFRTTEMIPIVFGPIAGLLLLGAGVLALRHRSAASVLATFILLIGFFIGLLGGYYHFMRVVIISAPLGEQISIARLVWSPPIMGPLTGSLVALLGISAAWIETPVDSGRLRLFGQWRLPLPYSKTRAYFFLVGLGTLACLISSVFDHTRTEFENPWLWVAAAAGVFGAVTAMMLGIIEKPNRGELTTFVVAMFLLIVVGVLGGVLHYFQDLTRLGEIVPERLIRGAPFLAPLLFADMGALGLLAMLDPDERRSWLSAKAEALGAHSE